MAATKHRVADRAGVPQSVHLRDARLSARFALILTYVLGTVAASTLINILSAGWGWSALWPVLGLAAWIMFLRAMLSIPQGSPVRHTVVVAIMLLIPFALSTTALSISDFALDPRFRQLMLAAAAVSAVGNLTLAILWPGWLKTWDGMSLTLFAALVAVIVGGMPLWLTVILGACIFALWLVGFLTLEPHAAPAMGRLSRRMRRAWVWLITEPSDKAPNRRRRPPHSSPGRRSRAPMGARGPTVRRSRTMRHSSSSADSGE